MSSAVLRGLQAGDLAPCRPYAERDEREPPWYDDATLALWHGLLRPALRPLRGQGRALRAFAARVEGHAAAVAALDDASLRLAALALRGPLRRDGFVQESVAECFALVREAASRVLGLRHYPSQVGAGWLLLQGTLLEMATGEGKTLAATLPALTAALAGLPVHVITVNDYLAERDAKCMGPLYEFFGLPAAAVVHGMSRAERRAAYAGAVTYVSNKELAFDYLRDRAALGDRAGTMHLAVQGVREQRPAGEPGFVLRGLVFAIVDEADSVFIDEARTPLILSRMAEVGELQLRCQAAVDEARRLQAGEHFEVDNARRRITLTEAGRAGIAQGAPGATETNEPTAGGRQFEEDVRQALAALWLYRLDEHYVVVDGKLQIVDLSTGRVMPDRAWEQGLHQMIECKEGLALTGRRDTLARITYQRLFRRYLRLAGMTGTAAEVAPEIGRTYGLPVATVALHRPSQRRHTGLRCLPDQAAKWQAVADAVQAVAVVGGRPVLIGTRTVKASEHISAVLQARGVEHVVLNARQDSDEARVVERAGEAGRVTVATNMAGRGTDIELGLGVAALGGLHVVLTEFNDSRRVDRQLIGRCARQGDPGSTETVVALDDEIFSAHAPMLRRALGPLALGAQTKGRPLSRAALALLRAVAQGAAGHLGREARDASLRHDRHLAQVLAFSGRGE
jgi:preprotein translocase subunit SecA